MKILNSIKKRIKEKKFVKVAEQQLKENLPTLESLRDYDAGKKDISTRGLETSLPNIHVTSRT